VSVEVVINNALKYLVGNRVYPDIAPECVKRPYITFQQVGGRSVNFLSAELPEKRNSRFQLNVWADSRLEAAKIAKQVDETLRQVKALQTTVLGEPVAIVEAETNLYGTRQDFSFWFFTQ
jgi:hypothetical protein